MHLSLLSPRVRSFSVIWTSIPAIKASVLLLLVLAAAFCTVGALSIVLLVWIGFESLQMRAEKGGGFVQTFLRCGKPYLRDVAFLIASLTLGVVLHPSLGLVPEYAHMLSSVEALRGITMTGLETLVLLHIWRSAVQARFVQSRARWTQGERVLGMIGLGLVLLVLIVGAVVPLPFLQGAWWQVLRGQLAPWKF